MHPNCYLHHHRHHHHCFYVNSSSVVVCPREKVLLVCGNRTDIRDISEPRTCEYVAELSTPLVCHPDSMLVFPTLAGELQDAWDELEGFRLQNIVTDQVAMTESSVSFLNI